ncbi:MAG: hypothetical protein IJB97_01460, partial [Clostridia bacterium]|nr:hypothetical protein [Clostridia bacterium]
MKLISPAFFTGAFATRLTDGLDDKKSIDDKRDRRLNGGLRKDILRKDDVLRYEKNHSRIFL